MNITYAQKYAAVIAATIALVSAPRSAHAGVEEDIFISPAIGAGYDGANSTSPGDDIHFDSWYILNNNVSNKDPSLTRRWSVPLSIPAVRAGRTITNFDVIAQCYFLPSASRAILTAYNSGGAFTLLNDKPCGIGATTLAANMANSASTRTLNVSFNLPPGANASSINLLLRTP